MRQNVGEVLQREGYSQRRNVYLLLQNKSLNLIALLTLYGIMKEVKQGNVSCINLYDQDFYC